MKHTKSGRNAMVDKGAGNNKNTEIHLKRKGQSIPNKEITDRLNRNFKSSNYESWSKKFISVATLLNKTNITEKYWFIVFTKNIINLGLYLR